MRADHDQGGAGNQSQAFQMWVWISEEGAHESRQDARLIITANLHQQCPQTLTFGQLIHPVQQRTRQLAQMRKDLSPGLPLVELSKYMQGLLSQLRIAVSESGRRRRAHEQQATQPLSLTPGIA